MENEKGCQIPCLPGVAEGYADVGPQPLTKRLKRALARPWNFYVKKALKKYSGFLVSSLPSSATAKTSATAGTNSAALGLRVGDLVRVKSKKEIEATLDSWKELKGCAFLEYMGQYCGTTQRVLKPMERFLDERDYKVKKCKGLVLLEGVICHGTPVFGRCDRCCHFFWREEWVEKIKEK